MDCSFNQFRKSIMFNITSINLLVIIDCTVNIDTDMKVKALLIGYYLLLIASFLCYLHFIVNVALQMSEILNIRIFRNKKLNKEIEDDINKTDEHAKDF